MLEFHETKLEGLLRIKIQRSTDERGVFTKLFHAPSFAARGLVTDYAEVYFSSSHRNVLRGLHFQTPPMDHAKIVVCQAGRALDVVVDIRANSTGFGKVFATELNAAMPEALYIPSGFAHGFQALEDLTVMMYVVSSPYSPEHDTGVLWSSIDFGWPDTVITSARDRSFPKLAEFRTPF